MLAGRPGTAGQAADEVDESLHGLAHWVVGSQA